MVITFDSQVRGDEKGVLELVPVRLLIVSSEGIIPNAIDEDRGTDEAFEDETPSADLMLPSLLLPLMMVDRPAMREERRRVERWMGCIGRWIGRTDSAWISEGDMLL